MTARRYFTANLDGAPAQKRIKKRFFLEAYLRARAPQLHNSDAAYSDETLVAPAQKHLGAWAIYLVVFFGGMVAIGPSFDHELNGFLHPKIKPIELRIRYGTDDPQKIKQIEQSWLFRAKTEKEELNQAYADMFWFVANP